jgi:hypothetical protein
MSGEKLLPAEQIESSRVQTAKEVQVLMLESYFVRK